MIFVLYSPSEMAHDLQRQIDIGPALQVLHPDRYSIRASSGKGEQQPRQELRTERAVDLDIARPQRTLYLQRKFPFIRHDANSQLRKDLIEKIHGPGQQAALSRYGHRLAAQGDDRSEHAETQPTLPAIDDFRGCGS